MWFILDLIIIAIIVIFMLISAKRGFARTIVEFVGYILAIYLAFFVGGTVSDAIYNKIIEPAIVSAAADKIVVTADAGIDSTVNNVWDALPDVVTNVSQNFGLTSDTLRDNLVENYANTNNATVIAENAVRTIVKPVLIPLLKSIIGVVLFAILFFVVKILAKMVGKIFKLPLIGGLNKFLGGVVGIGKGILICAVLVIVIRLIMSFTENGFLIFTNENIEQTILFKIFDNFSPFK